MGEDELSQYTGNFIQSNPLAEGGRLWGFDTYSVTVQYTENMDVFNMPSEVLII